MRAAGMVSCRACAVWLFTFSSVRFIFITTKLDDFSARGCFHGLRSLTQLCVWSAPCVEPWQPARGAVFLEGEGRLKEQWKGLLGVLSVRAEAVPANGLGTELGQPCNVQ